MAGEFTQRTKTALNNTVRFIENVPHGWIVQHRLTPTDEKWWYADSPFWLALTVEEFAEIKATYDALRSPAPTINLESFL